MVSILVGLVLLSLLNKICANSNVCQRRIDFDASKDMVANTALVGHTIDTISVDTAPECQVQCIMNSDCLSTNYIQKKNGGHCELKKADDILAKEAVERTKGVFFYRLNRKIYCDKGDSFDFLKHTCPKSTCLRSKCPTHTTCQEMCHPRYKRYICKCPSGNSNNCEDLPRTCNDIRKSLGFVPSDGEYFVYDTRDKLFQVYCDFSSEPGLAYTLIESFSFGNRAIFKPLGFYADSPFEESSVNWNKYRLSKTRMEMIAKNSTHTRATCNMHIKYSTKDYIRASLQGFPLFQQFGAKCLTYEYVSILGKNCSKCTTGTWQVANEHFHLNPGYNAGCGFGPTAGFSFMQTFGLYISVSSLHSCSSSPSSTTQYWLGTKYI